MLRSKSKTPVNAGYVYSLFIPRTQPSNNKMCFLILPVGNSNANQPSFKPSNYALFNVQF